MSMPLRIKDMRIFQTKVPNLPGCPKKFLIAPGISIPLSQKI
jgi:hypothetical protein